MVKKIPFMTEEFKKQLEGRWTASFKCAKCDFEVYLIEDLTDFNQVLVSFRDHIWFQHHMKLYDFDDSDPHFSD